MPLYNEWIDKHKGPLLLGVVMFVIGTAGVATSAIRAYHERQENATPYTLGAMNGTSLELELQKSEGKLAAFLIYRSDCGTPCDRMVDQMLALRYSSLPAETVIYLVSLGPSPEHTADYLKAKKVDDSFRTYYSTPGQQSGFQTVLDQHGSHGFTSVPHTIIFDDTGEAAIEYKTRITMRDLERGVRIAAKKSEHKRK